MTERRRHSAWEDDRGREEQRRRRDARSGSGSTSRRDGSSGTSASGRQPSNIRLTDTRSGATDPRRSARTSSRRTSSERSSASNTSRSRSATRRHSQRTTTRPSGSKRRPARSQSSQMRARKARIYREQRLRARNRRLAISAAGLLICIAVLVFAVRGITGCVSGALASRQLNQAKQAAAAKKQESVTIELAMIGDILQHAGVYESGFNDDGTRNYDHVFAHISGELKGADLKVVNQETVLGGDLFEFSGYPEFNGPQEMGDAEAKAGFNVILRATNHAMDMGYEGLSSELSFWRTKHPEVTVLGAVDPNDSSASVDDLYVYEKDGFKVALLNYTYDLNGYEDPKGAVSMLDEEHVERTVRAANAAADMVVVFPHWGEEYMLDPVQLQRDMAKVFLDAGADVIIGGHPHVIEPVEILTAPNGQKVPCFWSVGNFISTQVDNENLVGGIAKVTLAKDADGTCHVEGCSLVPTVTHKGYGSTMTTYLLRDYTDALAQTNYLESNETDNTSLTVSWANDFCERVLGSGFSPATGEIAFGAEEFAASTGAASTSDTETSTSEDSLKEAA